MKLNFKRIISFVAAAAMALSSFSMLTVSAENEETVISPIVQTASVAAQVRASGVNENGEWTGMNSSSSKIVESGDLESTAKSNFGIFYYFEQNRTSGGCYSYKCNNYRISRFIKIQRKTICHASHGESCG